MISRKIRKDGQDGTVEYRPRLKDITVDFPDKKVVATLEKYFSQRRDYKIPQSDQVDDYAVVQAFPYESEMYFDLALCTIFCKFGVYVIWEQ